MSGSCHLHRASNVEIGVECQLFIIVILCGAHSRYYNGVLTQKRSFLVICTIFRSAFHVAWNNQNKRSTWDSSFDALSKWQEPDIIVVFLDTINIPCVVVDLFAIELLQQTMLEKNSQVHSGCKRIKSFNCLIF